MILQIRGAGIEINIWYFHEGAGASVLRADEGIASEQY